jgi:hypothetical protein
MGHDAGPIRQQDQGVDTSDGDSVNAEGKGRLGFLTIREGGFATFTIACQPDRTCGSGLLAFDWGVETFATMATADGVQSPIANPRVLGQSERAAKLPCAHAVAPSGPEGSL